ncbi:MAG: hypothetical protein HY565_00240 [Candidatus Kerfeldbacteria bacterium]|nr:hypothetical protein [Candidatus Kerfeldbacteria bacterium]
MAKNHTVVLQLWRDALVALSIWLLLAYLVDPIVHGFMTVVWPVQLIAWIWIVNVLAWWYLRRRWTNG